MPMVNPEKQAPFASFNKGQLRYTRHVERL